MKYDYLVVGSGFFGSVLAERLANGLDSKVLVFEKRSHIGGNCYSEIDEETDIEFHKYGTHVFHTNSKKAWDYISQFTEFNSYYHQVLTTHKNKVYQMPINLETINSFYDLNLKPYEAKEFLSKEIDKENIKNPKNLEEKAISLIGRPLYEAFIRGYTIKQWGKDPKELSPAIITRLPVRYDYREDYFVNSKWQGIPIDGYTKVFKRMLNSSNIHVILNCDYLEHRNDFSVSKEIIYTGPIDRYFDYLYGRLEWRSVQFKRQCVDIEDYQGTSVMNYADIEVEYTRIHEPKHLHLEKRYTKQKTIIYYETSRFDPNNPYYPIINERNKELLQKYKKLARQERSVVFGGRLANYAYYDMDKTILAGLKCFESIIRKN